MGSRALCGCLSALGPPASCRHVYICIACRQDAGGPRATSYKDKPKNGTRSGRRATVAYSPVRSLTVAVLIGCRGSAHRLWESRRDQVENTIHGCLAARDVLPARVTEASNRREVHRTWSSRRENPPTGGTLYGHFMSIRLTICVLR